MVEETVDQMRAAGVRRALVFPTSAYGGYSACRQYDEDIIRARETVGPQAPELVKLRQFFDHPLFLDSVTDAVRAAVAGLPEAVRGAARLVFTAHSIPVAADAGAGPREEGGALYSRQIAEAARLVAGALGVTDYDVVWQSRSGPPQVPWLEPDIADHIEALHAKDVPAVVVCPIGFVSDHLEVVWDLDTEARELAEKLGMGFARAATAGPDPRFAELVVELIREHTENLPARKMSAFPSLGCTVNGALCATDCCAPPRRPGRPG
jgi:ferrochelatase